MIFLNAISKHTYSWFPNCSVCGERGMSCYLLDVLSTFSSC